MGDLIVKKAEHTGNEVALLSIDSPVVVTLTDLETAGLTSVTFPDGISVGGGGGTGEPVPAKHEEYFAICDGQFHAADMEGALPNGIWMGPARERAIDAFGDRDGHQDGGARVMYKVGSALLGPINQA